MEWILICVFTVILMIFLTLLNKIKKIENDFEELNENIRSIDYSITLIREFLRQQRKEFD